MGWFSHHRGQGSKGGLLSHAHHAFPLPCSLTRTLATPGSTFPSHALGRGPAPPASGGSHTSPLPPDPAQTYLLRKACLDTTPNPTPFLPSAHAPIVCTLLFKAELGARCDHRFIPFNSYLLHVLCPPSTVLCVRKTAENKIQQTDKNLSGPSLRANGGTDNKNQ